MAKRRTTRSKPISGQKDGATSPRGDVESNTPDLTTKPRPQPKPKPSKRVIAPSVLDAVDEIPHQRPKRGRSGSNADGTAPTIDQPLTKKSKIAEADLPVPRGGNGVTNSCSKAVPPRSPRPLRTNHVVNPDAPDQK